jgi:hypothetical protein
MPRLTLSTAALVGALSMLPQRSGAEEPSSVHQGSWPIEGGVKHQPTGNGRDVTSDQARELDRLYDQLLSSGDGAGKNRSNLRRGH